MNQTVILGKAIKKLARIRGGGSALPGYLVEKLDPKFLSKTLGQLPHGVVLITGTNGKTTTTKIITELFEAQGLRVLTNRTGSNFTRGIVSELLGKVDRNGKLSADIAVLELDEAHGLHFVRQFRPNHVVVLNVMRDQLDRFGEIDTTTRLLGEIVASAQKTVVLNGDDERIAKLANKVPDIKHFFFGSNKKLHKLFVSDDNLHGKSDAKYTPPKLTFQLNDFSGQNVSYVFESKTHSVAMRLNGVYNFLNSAAALTCVYAVDKKSFNLNESLKVLTNIEPAFGRGEILTVGGSKLDIVLVKNPSGFRLALESFDSTDQAVMIAINDQYADGRDMSWLWDVDFSSLRPVGVAQVSGIRAYDMAMRLQYDDVEVGQVDIDLGSALSHFIKSNPTAPKRIFCTYTAMLKLRSELAKFTKLERVL